MPDEDFLKTVAALVGFAIYGVIIALACAAVGKALYG